MTQRVSIDGPAQTFKQFGAYRILESFAAAADEDVLEAVRTTMSEAMQHFPELGGETITVARRAEWDERLGRADMRNRIIYLPAEHATTYITTYHELCHLAIQILDERGEDVPSTSENYCSLLALSRMPLYHIDEERVPYFGEPTVPKVEWPKIATAALAYRSEHHAYVQQAQEWFDGADGWQQYLPGEVDDD